MRYVTLTTDEAEAELAKHGAEAMISDGELQALKIGDLRAYADRGELKVMRERP